MSINLDCFDNIIGSSRTACSCYDSPPITTSDSGLYLDELSGLRKISAVLNCETGSDVWDYFEKAKEQGVLALKGDFNGLMVSQYSLRRKPFYGKIGKQKYSDVLDTITTGKYIGIRLSCANIVSGELVIKGITTIMNKVGVISLSVYNNLNELIDTIDLTTSDGRTENDIDDITLPLNNNYAPNMEYFFLFQTDGSIYPQNNEVTENLSGGSFYQSYAKDRTNGWGYYLTVDSITLDSVTDLYDISNSGSKLMNGLILDVELRCKITELLCKDYMDFEANPLAMVIAHAVRYKAAALLLQQLLRSPELNIDTITNREQISEDIDVYEQKYEGLLSFIVDNVDLANNDCFKCFDKTGIAGILV